MDFGERNRGLFKQWLKENPGSLCKITPILPESNKQRRYLEGAVIPLVTYYQEGRNHRSSADRDVVREWLKLEFNSETVHIGPDKEVRIAKSTRGREALNKFLEAVVEWLQDNYEPPVEALNPDNFKRWKAEVFSDPAEGDNYIDYLVEQKVLK